MQTRVVVFARITPQGGMQEGGPASRVLFAVPATGTLLLDLGETPLGGFAEACGLARHLDFDWAAGDAGARCALFEASARDEGSLPAAFPWPSASGGSPAAGGASLRWLIFPQAARALADGTDRRYLQLAVQYVSSGGVGHDLIAADTEGGLIGQLSRALEEQERAATASQGPAAGVPGGTAIDVSKNEP